MAASQEIRVALVGFGLGGRIFHAPFVEATPGMRLATIVTRDPERAAAAAAAHPGARIVADLAEVWARAADHDLVVVSSTNRTHVPIGLAALDAGLALVVDKPLAPTAAGGRALLERARERGLPFSVFQNRRWDGDFRTVRRLVAEGALGDVVRFESRYERWRPTPKVGAWRESADPEDAGGLLFDLGAHLIDQALVLLGPPTAVYAEVRRRRPGVVVDDDVFVALRHRGGEVSHLWANVLAAEPGPRFRILGTRATYEKRGMDVQEAALLAGARPGDDGWGVEPEAAWGTRSDGETRSPVPTEPGAYERYYEGMAAAMRGDAAVPVDPADSVLGLDVIEAAFASEREGRVVPFGG